MIFISGKYPTSLTSIYYVIFSQEEGRTYANCIL